MEIISSFTEHAIKRAAKALKSGHLVAFPTETVYGLGADATNANAVSKIYAVKGRPSNHPLIVHILSINQLDNWAIDIPDYALKLAMNFWPGPMTLILKRNELAKNFITGNQSNVGLRVPSQPVALSLLKEFEKLKGFGIAAPSANKFGAVSPTAYTEVLNEIGTSLGPQDLILDGGKCSIGIESTIIDCTRIIPKILRPGAITAEEITIVTGFKDIFTIKNNLVKVSGHMKSHYSPRAKVVLSAQAKFKDGFIALANIHTPKGAIRLAAPENMEQYARELYTAFRLGDKLELKRIFVVPPNGDGIAIAILDRLIKAAH